MPVDYAIADRIIQWSFGKLDKPNAKLEFPERGALSSHINKLLDDKVDGKAPLLSHQHCCLFASAGVEMWHRAIHSFLWSVAMTKSSPLWASVSGYYASHFVMRAFGHSMGIFKSFTQKAAIQVIVENGQFFCSRLALSKRGEGEHAFYWKAVKGHPMFISNDLFRENSERNFKSASPSDSTHRTFANYTDHLCSYPPMEFSTLAAVSDAVERIARIRLHSVNIPNIPSRDDYPDLQNVQILAFQRIIAFQDFLDEKVPKNRFWRAHRRPSWSKNLMLFQVEDQGLEQPLIL